MSSRSKSVSRSETAAKSRRRRLRPGCLVALTLAVAGAVLAVYYFGAPIRAAKSIEQQVNQTHQAATSFVPRADGSVSPDRVESFLRVRRRVFPHCAGLRALQTEAGSLGRPEDDPGSGDPEKVVSGLMSLKRLLGFPPKFIEFMNARNGALLDEGMGLGEYMYLYALAYGPRLQAAFDALEASEADFDGIGDDGVPSPRARQEITQILRNQQAALAASAAPDTAWAAALERELEALEKGMEVVPWALRRPPAVAASLAPHAAELAELFCPSLVRIELMQKNKGLQIEG